MEIENKFSGKNVKFLAETSRPHVEKAGISWYNINKMWK